MLLSLWPVKGKEKTQLVSQILVYQYFPPPWKKTQKILEIIWRTEKHYIFMIGSSLSNILKKIIKHSRFTLDPCSRTEEKGRKAGRQEGKHCFDREIECYIGGNIKLPSVELCWGTLIEVFFFLVALSFVMRTEYLRKPFQDEEKVLKWLIFEGNINSIQILFTFS